MKKFLVAFAVSCVVMIIALAEVTARAQGESRPWKGDGGAVIQPSQSGSAGTPVPTPVVQFQRVTFNWTNADIVALGATLDANLSVAVLPAKSRIVTAHMMQVGSASGPTTLTASVGRVGANFIDLLTAGNMKAAANTLYGDASAEVGTSLISNGYLTSWTATSDFRIRFLATGSNLDTVTGSSGYVIIDYMVYP